MNAKFILFAALAVTSAMAAPVTFSTSGVFSASGTSAAIFGGSTITFTGVTGSVANPDVTTSFGTFGFSSTTTGAPDQITGNFTLTITQTSPSSGGGNLSGTLGGKLKSNSNTVTFTPAATTVVVGNTTYAFLPQTYTFSSPSSSLQGRITQMSDEGNVPEPATMGLMSLSLAGLIVFRKRIRA